MNSLSVIMPAYNEVAEIRNTYYAILFALTQAEIENYEILIMTTQDPDGTDDGTSIIADNIAKQDARIKHYKAGGFVGLGFQYKRGVMMASKRFITFISADNKTTPQALINILRQMDTVPIIISYTRNTEVRPLSRRIISRIFTETFNLLFGLRLRYYNGISIIRRDLLLNLPLSDSPIYHAEILVHLLKQKMPYIETWQELKPTPVSKKVLTLKTFWEMLKSLIKLRIRMWKIK